MDAEEVRQALIDQKNLNLSGSLYHQTQLSFAYNTNHIEGSTITPDETASIYDTGTILTSGEKVINLKDATEVKNHFTLYIRGMREYQAGREKGYLIDTCLHSQDKYTEMVKYFLED